MKSPQASSIGRAVHTPRNTPMATTTAAATATAATSSTSVGARLLAAADAGDVSLVNSLLAETSDADVLYADEEEGKTALMAAAEAGHRDVVLALLQGGCPWNQQCAAGYCAGEYAAKRPDITELLMEWGVQAELAALEAADRADGTPEASTSSRPPASSENRDYLQQRLHYTPQGDKLLDANGEAVMMGWEAPLMQRHAAAICAGSRADVLNVGFGLGIVDTLIQSYAPARHTIIEAHPDVHAHMLQLGWDKKPGVQVLFGRWQDVLPQLLQEGRQFDGIFFDTYGEYYSSSSPDGSSSSSSSSRDEGIRSFHTALPRLLRRPGGIYSFFNGFASDNLFFHMVTGRVVQLELRALGLDTTFERLEVAELGDDVWQGVRSRYWRWPLYFLPVATWHNNAAAGKVVEERAVQERP